MRIHAALLFLLVLSGPALAATFSEDFEGFNLAGVDPETKPSQDWYGFRDPGDIGNVSATAPIQGFQSLLVTQPAGTYSSTSADLELVNPAQLSNITFKVKGSPPSETSGGTQQKLSITSSAPSRTVVEFFIICIDTSNPDACEFRVRWLQADSTGQVLINTTLGLTQFNVTVALDWRTPEFCLTVNGVDDGCFPFFELPGNVGRIRLSPVRTDYTTMLWFDEWVIDGAINATPTPVTGDAATGLKNFADDIRFTNPGSLFMLGLVILCILIAGVMVPLFALGRDNTVTPAMAIFTVLAVLWLVLMEWWPEWVGILLIIVVASLISLILRRVMLGIRDASKGAGLIVGCLGYFIIVATFLSFSGYAGASISLPTQDPTIDDPADVNQTYEQGFVEGTLDCAAHIVNTATFGLSGLVGIAGDCDAKTVGKTVKFFKEVGQVVATIFNYGKAALGFLFQLLTFQLPIPVIFNMMIVLPPAAALFTAAISIIRGVGN